jgi:hypothetical protein
MVGALCFSRGKQRFSVAGKSLDYDLERFSAGLSPRKHVPQPVLQVPATEMRTA